MSFVAKNYLIINVNHFKQLDHYFQSTYKLGIKVYSTNSATPTEQSDFKNTYKFSTKEFNTRIYENTQLNENFQLSFENECFPNFDVNLFIEVEFFVKGIKLKKFPANKEGFSSIGKNVLKVKNPFTTFHEYVEVVFDDLICVVVSFGIHSSLVGYEFHPLKRSLTVDEKNNPFLINLYKSKNFEEFFFFLTKDAEVEQVDSFYSDFLKRLKIAAEKILIFLVQVFKTLSEENKFNPNHPSFSKIEQMKNKIQNIELPYSAQFNRFIDRNQNQTLKSKFEFRETLIDNKNFKEEPFQFQSDINNKKVDDKLKSRIFNNTKISKYLEVEKDKNGRNYFCDKRETCELIKKEIEEFTMTCKLLFTSLKSLIDICGEVINNELRVDFHAILKDRYLENILTEKIEVENFDICLNKNYSDFEKLAEKFRKNDLEDEFLFEPFKVDNLTIFDKNEITPVFFEEIFFKKSLGPMGCFSQLKTKERSNLYLNIHASQKDLKKIDEKSFIHIRPHQHKKTHLIILVHGYQGSDFDLRLYKNYIAKLFPNSNFLLSNANKENKDGSILQMGKNLAQEILDYINLKRNLMEVNKISFIGHSLGGLVIRASLPYLDKYRYLLTSYISLSSPHLGCQISKNFLVGVGLSFLKMIKKSTVLKELDISDTDNFENSVLFRLSQCKCFGWFKNFVFVSSFQDSFVNYESARIQITKEVFEQKNLKSEIYQKMAKNIFENIQSDQIIRISIDVRSKKNSFSWMLGQAPHLQLLESHFIIKTLLYHYGDFLC